MQLGGRHPRRHLAGHLQSSQNGVVRHLRDVLSLFRLLLRRDAGIFWAKMHFSNKNCHFSDNLVTQCLRQRQQPESGARPHGNIYNEQDEDDTTCELGGCTAPQKQLCAQARGQLDEKRLAFRTLREGPTGW